MIQWLGQSPTRLLGAVAANTHTPEDMLLFAHWVRREAWAVPNWRSQAPRAASPRTTSPETTHFGR